MSGHLFSRRTAKKDDADKFTESDKIIVVLGACGAGKTQFINTAAGEKLLGVGGDLKIKTRDIQHARRHLQGLGDVILVDTPALPAPDSHSMTPEEIEKGLGRWLENAGKVMYGPKVNRRAHVSGVIYLHRITDNKLTDRVFLHRGMLRTLCGDRYAKRTVLVTTMWETLGVGDKSPVGANPEAATKARKEKREVEIKKKHWDLMEKEGAPPMHRHDGSTQSAHEAIRVLLERDEVDQPVILLLGKRSEDQAEFICDLARASNIHIKSELFSDLSSNSHSTLFQNIPIAKKSAEDPPSVETAEDSDRSIAIIALPSVDSSQCATEVKHLQRTHGRDIIAFLYLTSTKPVSTDGVNAEIDVGSLPEVLVEAMSSHHKVVIASKIEDPLAEAATSTQSPSATTDGACRKIVTLDFVQRWTEWNRKDGDEGGTPLPLSSAPVLKYGAGLHGAIEVVSTIWKLMNNPEATK